ncbi:MAG TPA: nuclear transport factor 2 family protein [Roseiflexaceae bacterium]|nr:nuclear transport factor 2 family protein [Roseiflexaceae bacterium]
MTNELHDFEQFMEQRQNAAQAYVSGDAAPLDKLVAHDGDATFFGPRGGSVEGATNVASRYTRDVAAFAPGSDNHFEILHMAASDGLAYWVGFQRSQAHMKGQAEAVPFNLRVTEIFRREGDSWKMIHRHADTLSTESE